MNPTVFQKSLELAAQVTNLVTVAVFVAVLACGAFWIASKHKDKRMVWVMGVIGLGMLGLGALPLLERAYEERTGVYAVRVMVLGVGGSPAEGSEVVCAPGGEKKRIDGGWECDVAPGSRPANGVFTAQVQQQSAFLAGRGELRLANDYHPVLTVRLQQDKSAEVRGGVKGNEGRALAGASVWVVGHEEERVRTQEGGGFVLATYAAPGQMVKLHAEAKGYPVYEGLQQAGDTSISISLVP